MPVAEPTAEGINKVVDVQSKIRDKAELGEHINTIMNMIYSHYFEEKYRRVLTDNEAKLFNQR